MYKDTKSTLSRNFNSGYALLIFAIHLLVILLFLFHGDEKYNATFFWAAGMIAAGSTPYLIAIASGKFILFEPVYLFLGGFIFNFAAPIFFLGNLIDYDPHALASVIQLAMFGCFAFLVGYFSVWSKFIAKSLPIKNFEIDDHYLLRVPGKLYFLWIALTIIKTLELDTVQSSLPFLTATLLRLCIQAALAIDIHLYTSYATLQLPRSLRLRYLARALIFLAAEIVRCFLSGFSGIMIHPIALMLLVYVNDKKKITPIVPVIIIAVILALTYFVTPFTKAFRSQYWNGTSLTESINYAFENLHSRETKEIKSSTLGRAANSLEIAIVVTQLKEKGVVIHNYSGFGDLVFRFIPRFIWPNKPSTNYNAIGHELGLLGPEDMQTSVAIPLFAGFILNGGVFGVLIGMFFVGAIIRIYWEWLVVRANQNFLSFIIYVVLVVTWVLTAEDLPLVMHANIAFLVYSYLFLGLIKRKGSS